jgi:2-haloacid dehalogenase
MTPQAVIFDIGNVLIEWNPERFYDGRIGAEARKRMFAETDVLAMNDLIDAGALFKETIYNWAARHPAWEFEIRWWYDHWIDMAAPRIDWSIALMRTLRAKGIPVHALTNFGSHSFDYALTQYDILHEFDRAFVSGRLGVVKPEPEIYRIVEIDTGFAPETLLFVDDRVDNIAAAAARGWRTHLFDGPAGWAQKLVAEGLLTPQEAGL